MDEPSYLGAWALIPELCLYQSGAPPRAGLYRIARAGEEIAISISWETRDGQTHSTAFSGQADGRVLPAEAGAPSFSLTHIDAATLDSAAFADGAQIAYARRIVSKAGDLMSVLMETRDASGALTSRNFQIYRRA